MEQASETNTATIPDIAAKLAEATQAMAEALHNINAQFEGLHAKVDRIVAAVEGDDTETKAEDSSLQQKLASTEKANSDLKAQAAQARRKTLSPLVTTLLAKEGVEGDALIVAESMAQRITRIPILPDGELGEAEIFADLSERGDHPDGLCVAADGSVWYAAHAHLTRVARGGAVLSRIALPFAFATSCVLGKGGDLYVTALRHRPGPDAPPQADAVLARVALPAHS